MFESTTPLFPIGLPDRILIKIDLDPVNGCWIWTGAFVREYPQVYWEGGPKRAHRVFYEVLVGPIPAGLVIDHLCKLKACCNPAHLEPTTIEENTRRGSVGRPKLTHCCRGHPYDEVNTRTCGTTGRRFCRACQKIRAANRKAAARATASRLLAEWGL